MEHYTRKQITKTKNIDKDRRVLANCKRVVNTW